MIHGYSYKPSPIFFRSEEERANSRDRFFGVELEMVFPDSITLENFDIQIQNEGLADRIYLKRDGSLGSYGVEVVSYPMTLIEHNNYNWERILAIASGLGAKSHDDVRCGMHVHINRTCLRPTDIKKMMAFTDVSFEKLYPYSRRTSRSAVRRFCPPSNITNYSSIESRKRALNCEFKNNNMKEHRGVRYRALNITNKHTVEFRFAQGTLRYESFMAFIELVDKIASWAKCQNFENLLQGNFNDFLKHSFDRHGLYIYLAQYMADRMVRKGLVDDIRTVQGTKFAEKIGMNI